MSHPQQHFFVSGIKQFLPAYFRDRRVLEVGSLNINGSVREFFERCEYIGLDIGPGRDVDVVCPGQDYGGRADSFDVVISCEAMEHNPAWKKTWLNMVRLARPDGLVVMTCATAGRHQHGTAATSPADSPLTAQLGNYYLNLTEQDFHSILPLPGWFAEWGFFVDHTSHDLYFFGVGLGTDTATMESARQLRAAFTDYYHKRNMLGLR